MPLRPFLMYLDNPKRLYDQQCNITLCPDEIISLISAPSRNYYRPWLQSLLKGQEPSRISSNKNKYQVNLDVQHFKPEEITVKTSNGFLVIEGQHDEKRDEHGWVTRQFKRRYELPAGCNTDAVQSRLSSDGVLTVTAPLESPKTKERIVPIIPTGPIRVLESKTDIEGAGEASPTYNSPAIPNGK